MARKKFSVLIVDDDKKFLEMLRSALLSSYNNLSIETANSGEECLRRVKQSAPNLVFLDVDMKGMNGLVTLRFIKSINAATLVYFLSGHSEKYLNEAVRMVPADGYFTKTQFLENLKNDMPLETILSSGKTLSDKK